MKGVEVSDGYQRRQVHGESPARRRPGCDGRADRPGPAAPLRRRRAVGVRHPRGPARRHGPRGVPAGAAHRAGCRGRLPGRLPRPGEEGRRRPLAGLGRQLALRHRPADRGEGPAGRRAALPPRTQGRPPRSGRPGPDDRPRGLRRPRRGIGAPAGHLPRAARALLPGRADARRGRRPPGGAGRHPQEPARPRPQEARRRLDAPRRRQGPRHGQTAGRHSPGSADERNASTDRFLPHQDGRAGSL